MKHLLAALATTSLLFTAAARAEPASVIDRVVGAADAFLATLGAQQRRQVVDAFDDAAQRARWSNVPTGVVRCGGISPQ